jgi:hypothetical protein
MADEATQRRPGLGGALRRQPRDLHPLQRDTAQDNADAAEAAEAPPAAPVPPPLEAVAEQSAATPDAAAAPEPTAQPEEAPPTAIAAPTTPTSGPPPRKQIYVSLGTRVTPEHQDELARRHYKTKESIQSQIGRALDMLFAAEPVPD